MSPDDTPGIRLIGAGEPHAWHEVRLESGDYDDGPGDPYRYACVAVTGDGTVLVDVTTLSMADDGRPLAGDGPVLRYDMGGD